MSKLNLSLSCAKVESGAFHSPLPRIVLCALLLLCVSLATSCGFITQSHAGESNANSLVLSAQFPSGVADQPYNSVMTVSGGSAPYQFSIMSGSLPQGISLNPVTGSISGTPNNPGSYVFEVAVVDADQTHRGTQRFAISVTGDRGGNGIHVTVSPSGVNVTSGQTQSFTAAVSGSENTGGTSAAAAGP